MPECKPFQNDMIRGVFLCAMCVCVCVVWDEVVDFFFASQLFLSHSIRRKYTPLIVLFGACCVTDLFKIKMKKLRTILNDMRSVRKICCFVFWIGGSVVIVSKATLAWLPLPPIYWRNFPLSLFFSSFIDLPDKTFYPTVSAVYGNTEVSMIYLGHPLDG